jgi:hypothetical protein
MNHLNLGIGHKKCNCTQLYYILADFQLHCLFAFYMNFGPMMKNEMENPKGQRENKKFRYKVFFTILEIIQALHAAAKCPF